MSTHIRHRAGSGMESYVHGGKNAHSATAQLWTDASFKKGAMGLGVVLQLQSAEQPLTWVVRCRQLGSDSTEAELHAIDFALRQAAERGHTRVVLHTDASMAIWHAANNTRTYDVMLSFRGTMDQLDCVQLQWIPRERNSWANVFSRMALSLPHSYAAGLALKKSRPERVNDWTPQL